MVASLDRVEIQRKPRLPACLRMCESPHVRMLRLMAGWLLLTTLGRGDVLKFRNGDLLQGTIQTATPQHLHWRSPHASAPIPFELTNLTELQVAPRPPTTARTVHGFLVELTNGDRLTGEIAALDEQTLTLDTWYAGRLVLQRAMVQRVECRAVLPGLAYSGPTGLSDWRASRAGWTYRRGKFYAQRGQTATIGRDVDLPAVASIDFDIAWRGQPYWIVSFAGADPLNAHRGGYLLSYSGHYLNLARAGGNRRNAENNIQISDRRSRTKAHLTIRINKPQNSIAVFLDGALMKQWTDPDGFAGTGRVLVFQSQGQADLAVANIVVAEWDGKLTIDTGPARRPNEDLVRLSNGDKVSGALQRITGGEATLINSYAAVNIPLARITAIEMAGQPANTARRQETDVRAYLPDTTRVTLALGQLDEKGLTGTTENCGRIGLPLDTFTRIQFRLYDKTTETDDDDWGSAPP